MDWLWRMLYPNRFGNQTAPVAPAGGGILGPMPGEAKQDVPVPPLPPAQQVGAAAEWQPARGLLTGGTILGATVPGFDPSDPGAYGNRTAGDQDLRGYGASPPAPPPDGSNLLAQSRFAGLAQTGQVLLNSRTPEPQVPYFAIRLPRGIGPGEELRQLPPSPVHRPQGLLSVNPFAEVEAAKAARRRKLP